MPNRVVWSEGAARKLSGQPDPVQLFALDESEWLWDRRAGDRTAVYPYPKGGMVRHTHAAFGDFDYWITFFFKYSQDEMTIQIFDLGIVRYPLPGTYPDVIDLPGQD